MTNKIVTLKDSTGTDNCYPITPVDAVFVDSNTTLSNVLDDKADIDMANIDTGSITADKIDFTTLNFGNYSTTEVDTGFTWVDGKHIYKKTVDCGDLVNTTYKSIAHGISNLACVISFTGMMQDKTTSNRRWRPLNIPNTNVQNYIIVEIDATYVWVYCGADRTNQTAWVTLYYTKTS